MLCVAFCIIGHRGMHTVGAASNLQSQLILCHTALSWMCVCSFSLCVCVCVCVCCIMMLLLCFLCANRGMCGSSLRVVYGCECQACVHTCCIPLLCVVSLVIQHIRQQFRLSATILLLLFKHTHGHFFFFIYQEINGNTSQCQNTCRNASANLMPLLSLPPCLQAH